VSRPLSPGSLLLDPDRERPNGAPFAPSPVFASTYRLAGDPSAEPMQYGRFANAGWQALEDVLGRLEGGEAVVFPSGMAAAIAVLNPLLRPGDRVLLPSDGYYTVRVYAETQLVPWGLRIETLPTLALADAAFDGVRLVWIETPSNPGLDCVDVRAIAARAHAAGTLVVVDNTTATPLGQRPLDLGADLVVSADTKALNGHSDVLFGHVAAREPELAARVRQWRTLSGSIPGPMETWLVQRGLMTLDVRLERMSANALAVARWLRAHSRVESVRYPGLPEDPAHATAARQMRAFGCLIGVTFVDAASARAFLERTRLIEEATSFGGVHSMAEQRSRWGYDAVPDRFVRLSVGIEPVEDLLLDMEAALA
jgi:cystathionine gamma-lyase